LKRGRGEMGERSSIDNLQEDRDYRRQSSRNHQESWHLLGEVGVGKNSIALPAPFQCRQGATLITESTEENTIYPAEGFLIHEKMFRTKKRKNVLCPFQQSGGRIEGGARGGEASIVATNGTWVGPSAAEGRWGKGKKAGPE